MHIGFKRKKQRILALMLAIMLVAGMLPSISFAEENESSTEKVQISAQEGALRRASAPQGGIAREGEGSTEEESSTEEETTTEGYVVTVKDAGGDALDGATVTYKVIKVTPLSYWPFESTTTVVEGPKDANTTTDKNGKIKLTELAGKKTEIEDNKDAQISFYLQLTVTKDGYAEYCNYDDEKNNKGDKITSITGKTDVNLRGIYIVTVVDTANNPLKDATVNYRVISGTSTGTEEEKWKDAKTDQNGEADLEELEGYKTVIAQGNCYLQLKVTKDGYYEACNYDDEKNGDTISSTIGKKTMQLTYSKVTMIIEGAGGNDYIQSVTVGGKPVTKDQKGNYTVEVSKNTKANEISITPVNGYRVDTVTNKETTIENSEKFPASCGFTGTVDVAEDDITLTVTFEEVYTVTVKVDGNGTVTTVNGDNEVTTQKDSEGKVTVKKNADNKFTITATPKTGCRLVKFEKTAGGETETEEFEENDASYETSVEIEGDTTFTAKFEENRYNIVFKKTGGDGTCEVTMKIKNKQRPWEEKSYNTEGTYPVSHEDQISFSIKPSVDCNFDEIKISGNKSEDIKLECKQGSIDVYEYTKDVDTLNDYWKDNTITFDVNFSKIVPISKDSSNPFEMKDYYSIEFTSGSETVDPVRTISVADGKTIYVLPKDTLVTLKPDGTNYDWVKCIESDNYRPEIYNTEDNIIDNTKGNMELDKIYLYSQASGTKCTIDCKMEFVIDKEKPELVTNLPAAVAVENGINCYNKDVTLSVEAADQVAGKCSGIKSVKYWIIRNGIKKEEATLYTYEEGATVQETFSGSIKVDAKKYNCDGIEIHVEVVDRVGNVTEESKTINIDTTPPQVSLTYDNNNNYKHSEYFNAVRMAKVVVKEREDNFDHAKATQGIVITAKDANNQDVAGAYTISEWQTQRDQGDDNQTTHTAMITFLADANYTLAMSFQDIAGNSNAKIVTGKSVAPYAFTVDTKAPTGTLTAKSKEGRSSTWEKLITDLKFGYYSKAKITLSGTSADETSPILSVQYYKQVQVKGASELKALSAADLDKITDWKDFKEFSVSQDEKFVVYLKITDSAGNYTYISTDGLIVDEHAPVKEVFEPKVTIEPEQPVNGYYNKDVTVKLKVEDPEINGTYTGLKEISYKVYNESVSKTEPTQEETLLSFAVKNPAQSDLVQKWDGKIKVDSSKNNSNHVLVEVYAEDNAGNGVTYTKKLKIDTTAPDVNIKYSNNSAVGGSYFNTGRTATIEVTERNFDINDMKIKITNTDGAAPKVSDWKQTKGTGNGDNTKWTATVNYAQDGDYTFDIAYKDRAGNKAAVKYAGGTVAAEEFTIDRTKPVINVSYDNNNVHNGEYYNTARRATVSITEHNFDPQKVETTISATENGAAVAAPAISGWSTNGDVHTATISYANDARYTFDISVTDMAGNAAGDFAEQSFYVDQTAPELQITGVKDQSANAGDVIPVVTYSDSNFDADALHIELTGANRKEVKPDGSYSNSSTGGSFTFKNFAKTQNVDDIYVLSATLTDRAGNTVSDEVTFSVNRFGSTYDFSDRTEQINGSYIQASEDIVVVETNPTKLTDIKVTLFQNNETLQLTEGQDYDIRQTGGNGQWYHYTYTVHKDVFEEDGIYKLVLHSKDGAENISENILETKDAEISFGVDKTKPNIVVANLDSKQTYALDNMTVIMSASDNLKLTEVMVYLDDSLHAEWKDESLETMLDQSGDLTFDIPGTSNHAHKVKIVCRDAAGNEAVQEITGFYVTTNLWVRYFNNKPLFYGSILAMAAALGFIVFIVVKRRKKEEE